MKIVILSDIHGNFEALQAVENDFGQLEIDKVICLGDIIGYGPDPDQVVDFVRDHGFLAILGNHEFALKDIRGRRWLNFQAAENNEMTEQLLSQENREYCSNLPGFLQFEGAHFVHGYPKDNVFRYLNRQPEAELQSLFTRYSERFFFIGHTHRLHQIVLDKNGQLEKKKLSRGQYVLMPEAKYIFNCGSVGQPRDKDNSAKYIIWDSGLGQLEVRFVEYDFSKTIEKIHKRGFPAIYGQRLR